MSEHSQTRQELEAAIRRLVGDTTSLSKDAKGSAKSAAPAVGLLAALLAFAYGRRRGRRRSASVRVQRRR